MAHEMMQWNSLTAVLRTCVRNSFEPGMVYRAHASPPSTLMLHCRRHPRFGAIDNPCRSLSLQHRGSVAATRTNVLCRSGASPYPLLCTSRSCYYRRGARITHSRRLPEASVHEARLQTVSRYPAFAFGVKQPKGRSNLHHHHNSAAAAAVRLTVLSVSLSRPN